MPALNVNRALVLIQTAPIPGCPRTSDVLCATIGKFIIERCALYGGYALEWSDLAHARSAT